MTQGMQALITGQKTPKAVMESVEAASQKAGARKFTDGLRLAAPCCPIAARRSWRRHAAGYAFAGPALADPRGVPALPDRLLGVAELSRVGRLHAALGAVRRPRELSRAGRRRGLLAGHAELHRLRRRAHAARGRPRLPAGPPAEPPAGRAVAAAHALLRAGRHVADRGDDHLPARLRAEHRPPQHVSRAPSGSAPGRIPGWGTRPPRSRPSSRSACGRTWDSAS